jgi:hypothetical protein
MRYSPFVFIEFSLGHGHKTLVRLESIIRFDFTPGQQPSLWLFDGDSSGGVRLQLDETQGTIEDKLRKAAERLMS